MSSGLGVARTVTYSRAPAEILDADLLTVLLRDLSAKSEKNWPGSTTGSARAGSSDRVQPQEAGAGVAVDQRVAGAAEADQAVGELDDVLLRDLDGAEADALESDGHCRSLLAL